MDLMTRSLINSGVLVTLSAILTFLAAKYWYGRKAQDETTVAIAAATKLLTERVTELESEHRLVKATVVPITTAFQTLLIQKLTHFHTPEMDALMVKIGPPNSLSLDEHKRLIVMLEDRERDMGDLISEDERKAAQILPIVMELAKTEQAEILKESTLAVVMVPKTLGNGIASLEIKGSEE